MELYKVTLEKEERDQLEVIAKKGSHSSQKVIRALTLLNCDQGEYQEKRMTNQETASALKISQRTVERTKKRFVEEGLDIALTGRKSERVYEKKVDGDLEARLVALSCGPPPEGFARWSLRLLSDKAVELEYVESISHETVRGSLKKTN